MKLMCKFTFFLCLGMSTTTALATDTEQPLFGGGAHFSWIIFNAIKPDLEQVSGRKISLFGKDSMLGQGCGAGIKNARLSGPDKETFGFVCCALSDEEIQKEKIVVHPLALEPVLIMVNSSNSVTNLSSTQIRRIFRGEITNWKEVGGRDQAIVVITRLHCKERPGHWKRILPTAADFTEKKINIKSADEMVQHVSDFPGAIGHIGATWIFNAGNKVRSITVDGIKPTADNLQNKTYPFFRKLSAITNETPSPAVLKVIREAQTGAAFRREAERFNLLPLN
ncbi:MAG: substrate-binding domain-containing protein [Gammaproteobacteria bacterium]